MDLLTPSSPGGLPTLSLTTNSSWCYLGEGCHASHESSDAITPNIVKTLKGYDKAQGTAKDRGLSDSDGCWNAMSQWLK